METFAQCLPLFTFKFDEPMWNAILIEKIIEPMPIACVALGQHTHSGEFAIPPDPSAPHDQCVHNCLADFGDLGERAPELGGRNVEYLGVFRHYPGRRQR